MSYSLAAAVQQNSPIYVVHKIGGDPGEGQFLTEPPKEIPHGYTCAYIPDSVNPTRSVQMVTQELLEQTRRNKCGWQSMLPGRMLSHRPQEFLVWSRSVQY